MDKYQLWLSSLPNVGSASIYRLLEEYGNPFLLYEAVRKKEGRVAELLNDTRHSKRAEAVFEFTKKYDTDVRFEDMMRKDISFVTYEEQTYPKRLRILNPEPYALFYSGRLPEDDIPAVAIIGARECSEYGTFVANAFGEGIAMAGVNIISGMARGVDGISQRGALNVGGNTFAVLGSGVDVCYPAGNFKLYREIKEKGGILSLMPPGTQPQKALFPERNKIVSALSDIVLVVEARQKSGTSITVECAMNQNKEVYAVPGRLTDRLSDGCNVLIREGAGIALSPEDILNELSVIWNQKNLNTTCSIDTKKLEGKKRWIPPEDEGVIKYVDFNPLPAERIHEKRTADEPEVPLCQTMSELMLLCVEGRVTQVGSGYFCLNANGLSQI